MQKKIIILKPGKEKPLRNRHHWVFSGAVQDMPSDMQDGGLYPVVSSAGAFLGTGYFNRRSKIIGRMVAFDQTDPFDALKLNLDNALALRKQFINFNETNGFRLVNGEGDGIPGLVIDVYDRTVVMQITTLGMEKLKPWIVNYLIETLKPEAIFEKSIQTVRKEEGLIESQGFLYGACSSQVNFMENGLHFTMDLFQSQKTGFFLDHREMRQWVRELAKDKHVLNAFSYTGGFSVYALAGGAKRADSMDISYEAIEAAKNHMRLNGYDETNQQFFCVDAFKFLREQSQFNYELMILDPPAFAKKQKDVIPACRGYKDINRLAMQKLPSKALLLSCSCSHYVDETLFQKVLFQAAAEAKRNVKIVGRHRLAVDHPINLYHPETNYLKSFLLYIE